MCLHLSGPAYSRCEQPPKSWLEPSLSSIPDSLSHDCNRIEATVFVLNPHPSLSLQFVFSQEMIV